MTVLFCRKHPHHGQLLPGSTESEEEAPPRKVTCWSEGASPASRPDPATPLIAAIRSELARFQRSPHSGVTITGIQILVTQGINQTRICVGFYIYL